MDILTAQDAPVTHNFNGKSYTFPLWKTRELLPVLARIKAARREILQVQITANKVPPQTAAYMLYEEEAKRPVNPYDAHDYFQTAEGVDECLLQSLIRGGTPQEEAQAVVDGMKYAAKSELAYRVAGVVEARPQTTFTAASKANEGLGLGDAASESPKQPQGLGEAPVNPTQPA